MGVQVPRREMKRGNKGGEEEEEEKEGTFAGTTCAQLSRLANTPRNAAHAIFNQE